MTVADAAKILDLPADASSEQIEARYLELQAQLEGKIARAPTDGLKAKYREALARAGEACDTLLNSSPTDLLPTKSRGVTPPPPPPAAPVAPSCPSRTSAPTGDEMSNMRPTVCHAAGTSYCARYADSSCTSGRYMACRGAGQG